MSAVAIPARRRNAGRHDPQLSFDYLLGGKDWFSCKEAAGRTGLSQRFIEQLFDEGRQLSGHEYNGRGGKRMTKRIPRSWLIALLINTARYDAETKLQAFVGCLREFPREQLLRIADAARTEAFSR